MRHFLWLITLLVLLALTLVPTVTSAQTADGVIWRVEFYDNWYLQGNADWTGELGGPLNVNWGLGGPAGGIPVDGWAARLTANAYFPAGRYRFTMDVDDGAKVVVSGITLIDITDFKDHAPGVVYAEMTLNEGFHQVQITFIENLDNARLIFNWQPVPVTTTNDPVYFGTTLPSAQAAAAITGSTSTTTTTTTSAAAVPVTGTSIGNGRVTAARLNVRSEARVATGNILGVATFGQELPLLGQTSNGWWQVDFNGQVGYVSVNYVSVPAGLSIPIVE